MYHIRYPNIDVSFSNELICTIWVSDDFNAVWDFWFFNINLLRYDGCERVPSLWLDAESIKNR